MHATLKNEVNHVSDICRSLNVKRLYAFGSVLTEEFSKESDLDFLISFPDGMSVENYTDNYFSAQYKFRQLFQREVDIITERSLSNPFFIERINETKELIYEA